MIVLRMDGETLTKTACIDQVTLGMGQKWVLDCIGYIRGHIIWVGLENVSRDGVIQVYDYDTQTNNFRELQDKRVSHEAVYSIKFNRLHQELFSTGRKGRLMSLSLTN